MRRLLAFLFAAFALPWAASAQEAAFSDREIALNIGFGPGGGYDTYARLLARHWPRHIPGAPKMVPKNQPGAGGVKLASTMYNVARNDGTELALFATSAALEPLFGNADAKYDAKAFTWIGNIDSDVSSCGTWRHAGIKTWTDAKTRETIFGASGPAAITSIHPRIVGQLLGLRIKVIHGYQGTRDVNLAMQKGEVDGTCGMYMSSIRSQFQSDIDAGDLTIWITLGKARTKEFPDVPSVFELITKDEDRQLAELIFGQETLGRLISAPPGMAPERVAILRRSFDATMADPDFLAEAGKLSLSVQPMTGEEVARRIAGFFDTPRDVVQRAIAVMK
jgi:tripartite-type tricarboxylate transporter receptor subunit TctC